MPVETPAAQHPRPRTCAEKLAAAGTILIGKLTTREFADVGPSFDLPWPSDASSAPIICQCNCSTKPESPRVAIASME